LTVDLVLTSAKAYVEKEIIDCSLAIDNGKIFKIGKETTMPAAMTKTDLRNLLVLPGLTDAHVHLRDEGKAYKEDFCSGTAAAAAGGFTTVLDMPNNDPVTMTAETLRHRMKIAEKKVLVNVGFYSEFPRNMSEITRIVQEGAVAFKLYMTEQVGGLNVDDDTAMLEAFKITGRLNALVAVHAEDKTSLVTTIERLKRDGHNDIDAYLEAHSEDVEAKAVKRMLNIVKQTNSHVHFCHVSTEKGIKIICDAKKSAAPITCETTPHNLCLSTRDLRTIGTLAVTMPPVREKRNVKALWKGVKNGCIDILASDHAPHALDEKSAKSIWDVKVGIPGLETALSLLLTEVKHGLLTIADVVRLMSERPAQIFKLKGRGCLKRGYFADLTVVDMKRKYRIDASNFKSKAKYSPFDGSQVEGKPVKTFVNGQLVMNEGEIIGGTANGQVIRRK